MIIYTLKFDKKKAIFIILMASLILFGIIMLASIDSTPKSDGKNVTLYAKWTPKVIRVVIKIDPNQLDVSMNYAKFLEETPFPPLAKIEELDREFIEKNLSPGGSADLLALTYFLHFLEKSL